MLKEACYEKKRVLVRGYSIAYVEIGQGSPIVFLHGNPTSSYLWRNIIPYVEKMGRCVAPDLIGMGDSDKLENSGPNSYDFFEHREYLDAFLAAINVNENVVLVLHDWGSALGFDWANRHQKAVRGIVYMESIVREGSWKEISEPFKSFLKAVRSPTGEQIVLTKNSFIEKLLPQMVIRKLTGKEMEEYRRPFLKAGESRRPMLSWPRQIVLDGNPLEVGEIIRDYAAWLPTSDIPKLFVNADPGTILVGSRREFCRGWANQTEITVKGKHLVQEDSPDQIGKVITDWLATFVGR
ncbi:MAG: haloalkane dehalogenase [Candidatus Thiodiazotropha taylori]